MVEIEAGDDGQRVDNYLMRQLKGVPKSHIYRLLRKGEVRLNKGRVKPSDRLTEGDMLRIPPVRYRQSSAPSGAPSQKLKAIEKSIIFEDQNLIVINKPSGMAVHGGSGQSFGVIELMRQLRPEEKQLELVHRLDRDTSGCLMLAKKRSALRILHELQQKKQVKKQYLSLLVGNWRKKSQKVDVPLRKNLLQGGERVVRVDPEGKTAVTYFSAQEAFAEATLVEATLGTGRTHQIRVHAAHLGSPILGDPKYGDQEMNRKMKKLGLKRLFLHASRLKFPWPGQSKGYQIEAPLPEDLVKVLKNLRESE